MKTNNTIELPPKILLYQDDGDIGSLVEYLEYRGFIVERANNKNVSQLIKSGKFDICILDKYKQERLIRAARQISIKMPVIILSSDFEYSSIITAFNLLADDYITKPYNMEELVCRIRAVLRRSGFKARTVQTTYTIGEYTFDVQNNELIIDGHIVKITDRQGEFLALLCSYMNEYVPYNIIIQRMYGGTDSISNQKTINSFFTSMRKALSCDTNIVLKFSRKEGGILLVLNRENMM